MSLSTWTTSPRITATTATAAPAAGGRAMAMALAPAVSHHTMQQRASSEGASSRLSFSSGEMLACSRIRQPRGRVSVRGVPAMPHLTIRCARVGGVEVPNAKRIEVSLQYIHGVGLTTARQILLDVEMENKLTKELTEEELTKLRDEVSKYMTEGDLRRFNQLAIKRLRDIQCYRGRRHIMGLPCRGQHTKCNARTRKGKKVTVAGKKKAPGK